MISFKRTPIILSMKISSIIFIGAALVSCGEGSGSTDTSEFDSSDSQLGSLMFTSGRLDQIFQPNQLEYSGTVGYFASNTFFTAEAQNPNARITLDSKLYSGSVDKEYTLNAGEKTIELTVTSEDGLFDTVYSAVLTQRGSESLEHRPSINTEEVGSRDFGTRIVVEGNTMAISDDGGGAYSPSSSGLVFIFERDANDNWMQTQKLLPSNPDSAYLFGNAMDIDGDTLVIGAHHEASVSGDEFSVASPESGAVYIFEKNEAGQWIQTQLLKASNADAEDFFGVSVLLDGDVLFVGSNHESSSLGGGMLDNSVPGAGAVYIFEKINNQWSEAGMLKTTDPDEGDLFGSSLALENNILVVGAILENGSAGGGPEDESEQYSGAAYIFENIGGNWTQVQRLKASNAQYQDAFGAQVAISSNTIVVTAYNEDSSFGGGESDNSQPNSGAAYVFIKSGASWVQQQIIKATNAQSNDRFGSDRGLYLKENVLMISAPFEKSADPLNENNNDATDAGAVYVYENVSNNWQQVLYLKSNEIADNEEFGGAVLLSGDTIFIGADNGNMGNGKVYLIN